MRARGGERGFSKIGGGRSFSSKRDFANHKKRGGNDGDGIVICGRRMADAALACGRTSQIWLDKRGGHAESLAQKAESCGAEVAFVSAAEIATIVGHSAHQGIAAAVRPPTAKWEELLIAPPEMPIVVLDGVTDPRNLGAAMRAAWAFNSAGVVALHRRSAPLSAAAAKASAGAAAFLPLYRVVNLRRALQELRDAGRFILGASEKAESDISAALAYASGDNQFSECWVLGDEGGGLRRLTAESCDALIRLPTVAGASGCLNVAAACAACLAISAVRKRLPEQDSNLRPSG